MSGDEKESINSSRRRFLKYAAAGTAGVATAYNVGKSVVSEEDLNLQEHVDKDASTQALRTTMALYEKQGVPEALVADIIKSYVGNYEEIFGKLNSDSGNAIAKNVVTPAYAAGVGGLTALGIIKVTDAAGSFAEKLTKDTKEVGKSTQNGLA